MYQPCILCNKLTNWEKKNVSHLETIKNKKATRYDDMNTVIAKWKTFHKDLLNKIDVVCVPKRLLKGLKKIFLV